MHNIKQGSPLADDISILCSSAVLLAIDVNIAAAGYWLGKNSGPLSLCPECVMTQRINVALYLFIHADYIEIHDFFIRTLIYNVSAWSH
jgi:hypothetical protein